MSSLPVSQNLPLLDDWRKTLDNEIVRSPCKSVDNPDKTLIVRILNSLQNSERDHPGKAAVIDGFNQEKRLTYGEIRQKALSVAAFLQSRGFGIGDRATTILFNCVELPVVHLGVWAVGGVFVGSKPAFQHHETVYQLRDSESSVIFTSEDLLDSVLKAIVECSAVKLVVCIRSSTTQLPNGVVDFREVFDCKPIDEVTSVSLEDPCLVLYSSGTTGLPKGVVHTHRTYHSNIETLRSHFLDEVYPVLGVKEVDWHKDCQIMATASFHMLGFGLLNWWLLAGSPIVLMERLDETLYPQLLAEFKPRYLFVTPPIFAYLCKHPLGTAARLDSVQLILSSAAPLSQEISNKFFAHHPSVKYIVQGYGMTETGYSHLPLLLREGANASSGVVASGYKQKIVVPGTVTSCPRGDWGEICVKGPGVTVGYLNKPEATDHLFDEEGWLHTGDIGYLDELGCINIIDRVKELIKVNYMHQSIQMSPAELEGILLTHHKVRDVAVVGVKHEDGGELVRAFVVKAELGLTGLEIEQIISDKLAAYKRITGGVVFLDAIPRSATGKILRRELRESY